MSSNIILITGESSGFGALTARALADDGSEEVSDVADRVRNKFLARVGLADLLTVTRS